MCEIASTRATRRPDAPRARPRLCEKQQRAGLSAPRRGGVSDAVVVDVARVGDRERLTISETLRLSIFNAVSPSRSARAPVARVAIRGRAR